MRRILCTALAVALLLVCPAGKTACQECRHDDWEDGICTNCFYRCPHEKHSRERVCLRCGACVNHSYVDGVCSVCGNVRCLETDTFNLSLWEPCPNPGKVVIDEYFAGDRDRDNGSYISKYMSVYLPYGYSEDKDYDLLILIPGLGGTYRWALVNEWMGYASSGTHRFQDLLDNMIYTGLCKPVIVVNISWGYSRNGSAEQNWYRDMGQVAGELRNDILPYLIDHYSLYAKDDTAECISANRDHFGIFGFSYGSMIVNASVLPKCFDLFGWYAAISPSRMDMSDAVNTINSSRLPLRCYIAGTGAHDVSRKASLEAYSQLLSESAKCKDGINCCLIDNENWGHDGTMAMTAIYDTLLLFFTEGELAAAAG